MHHQLIKRTFTLPFALSCLLHVILLCCMMIIISWEPEKKKKLPHSYTSAYIYKGNMTPISTANIGPHTKPVRAASRSPLVNKPTKPKTSSIGINKQRNQSVLNMTQQFLQQNQETLFSAPPEDEPPMYMIGDKNSPVDPLATLVGRALSANFSYPHRAAVFGIRGRALVGFTLHPNGRLTNVRLIQSTEDPDLDSAALYAVNAAPLIHGVDKFVTKARFLVVAFIFR